MFLFLPSLQVAMNTEYMNIAMNKGMLFADNIPLLPNNMPLLTDKNGDGYVSSNGAFFSSLSASHNWSGQDVRFVPQRMPCSLPMTSSIFCPLTSELIPCRFPLQPPIKNTCCMTSYSSAVTSMTCEHTPVGLNIICFVFIILSIFITVYLFCIIIFDAKIVKKGQKKIEITKI